VPRGLGEGGDASLQRAIAGDVGLSFPLLPSGEKMSVRTDEGVSDEGANV